MKSRLTGLLFSFLVLTASIAKDQDPFAIVVHGGAGGVDKEWLTEERVEERFEVLQAAVDAGNKILESGGRSLDAVEAAIVVLEDSPFFNAGKGAVFTRAETNELDASVMDGKTMKAGAVGGVMRIRNPIRAARAVMEQTPHVMLGGDGADRFAKEAGLEIVEPDYFRTQYRLEQLHKFLERKKESGDTSEEAWEKDESVQLGTVGAVAIDRAGNIAAGTSTGGLTGKKFGRIGDSPIIGAGTYAKNAIGGISCTGHGEYFIRYAVAHDVIARADYKGTSLEKAAEEVVHKVLREAGGAGGLIGIDSDGKVVMKLNTAIMWRAWRDADGVRGVAVHPGDRESEQ